jgi:hypothetical protein
MFGIKMKNAIRFDKTTLIPNRRSQEVFIFPGT